MGELIPFAGGLTWRESRALAQLQSRGRFDLIRIEQNTILQQARAAGTAEVAGVAMDAVARVTMHAKQLTQLVPEAAGPLTAIVQALTVAEAGIVQETAWRLR